MACLVLRCCNRRGYLLDDKPLLFLIQMPQQPLSTIKAMAVMHFSLLTGQLMFAGIAYYLKYTKVFSSVIKDEQVLLLIVPALIALAVIFTMISYFSFKKKVESISKNDQPVTEKLAAYRAASIIRWAMLEAPVLLLIIGFLLTGTSGLLLVIAVMLIMFVYTKPTIAKTAAQLGLREEEVK